MIGSSFQTLGAATEKARLPKLSFVLGTISYCEVDDLSCLGIFERFNKIAIQDKNPDASGPGNHWLIESPK